MSRKERRREKKLGGAGSAAAPTADSRQALAQAKQLHQAGRLQEAQGIYLRVLKREPENADALSLMGLLAHQAGRNDVAAELLGKALALRPRFADAHLNLGNVLRAEGDLEAAVGHFREAARIDPGFPGRVTTRLCLRIAAVCRDRIAVGTPASSEARRICSPKPGMVLSQACAMASGVTSRGAGPVPPVVQISAQPSSA